MSLAAQVQQFCKLAASASAETSRAALSQTSQVSTAAAALKLGCFSYRSAHEQGVLAVCNFPKNLLVMADPGKSVMCCAVIQG